MTSLDRIEQLAAVAPAPLAADAAGVSASWKALDRALTRRIEIRKLISGAATQLMGAVKL